MLFGCYNFKCRFNSKAILPQYKGSTFRGAFGNSLKRAVCVTRNKDCHTCLLFSRCIYAQSFEAQTALKSRTDKSPTIPPPYIIEPPLESKTQYSTGDEFNFSLILFGRTNDALPYFIYAFEIMGEIGIGKKIDGNLRGTFTLDSVLQNKSIVYDSISKKVQPVSPTDLEYSDKIEESASSIKIKFLTPLRLKHHNELSSELPFHLLVRGMLRRISSLFENFGDGEPAIDYRQLVQRAEQVQTADSTLRWHDWERYSNRQENSMMMGGVVGSITYSGELTDYLPLLKLSQKLHIGKQTSFGLGKFEYEILG